MKRKIYKASVWALVNFPFYQTCVMTLHVLHLLLGRSMPYAEMITGVSLLNCVLVYLMSVAFKCCALHRLLCLYPFLVSLCIQYERWFSFGPILTVARVVVLSLGVVLIGLSIFKGYKQRSWKTIN